MACLKVPSKARVKAPLKAELEAHPKASFRACSIAYSMASSQAAPRVYVSAVCGPLIGRESKGNITGHGLGYFLTSSEDGGYFYIGSSMRAAMPRPRQTPSERARNMVARLRQTLNNH